MNIHEYQAKSILRQYGVTTLRGGVACTPKEAESVAKQLGGPVWVVKSQIHAGGRGAGRFSDNPKGKGGVRVVKSVAEVKENAKAMLGHILVTRQTGPQGKKVGRLYIEEGCDIAKEFYLSMLINRRSSRVNVIASAEGGISIEETAEHSPEKIMCLTIDPATGLQPHHGRVTAASLGLRGGLIQDMVRLMDGMYKAFTELDASVIELNPLVVTTAGELVALDAKMSFDDNALYRHPELLELRDETEEDPLELEASRYDLQYIKLDGNIGCMVNGAGLAMATMDIIKLKGGEPANFLDVGGGASKEKVTAALKLILSDKHVKGVLINIFGGIMRCDILAEGVIAAAREIALHVPLVVRLEGTNVELGRRMLNESGLPITTATDLGDAAEKIIKAVGGK